MEIMGLLVMTSNHALGDSIPSFHSLAKPIGLSFSNEFISAVEGVLC